MNILIKNCKILILFGLLFVFSIAFTNTALCQKIQLVTGDPTKTNTLGDDFVFTLVAPDGKEQTFKVNDIKKEDNAIQKAIKIQLAVAGVAGWDAVRDGNKLTFKKDNKEITKIKNIIDKTGEEETIEAVAALWGKFDFGLDNTSYAYGYDSDGNQSLVSFETSLGDAVVQITENDTAEYLIDCIIADLVSDGLVEGTDIIRISSTTFDIFDYSANPFITYQITDMNIFVNGGSGEAMVPEPTTMILLGSGLIGLAGLRRKFIKN